MTAYSQLIDELTAAGYLRTPRIIDAFRKTDRGAFVPDGWRDEAYGDCPLPIGRGQTISQPRTVAFMVELLDPREGETILEVGSGSGWQTAILSRLAGREGHVVAVERIQELYETAKSNVGRAGCANVTFVHGDGTEGYADKAPYNKIIAGAAGTAVPTAWRAQLGGGGVIVAPLGTSVWKITKLSGGTFKREEYPGFVFVPLIEGEAPPHRDIEGP